ncbi:MAG: class I SAM-dependent methyltransferase [Anaerolineae bacterium]|nr:class I SAM-dependent methyltransferase [Anaerolineae bacterium]MCB0230273.1 class I SAM-dependent methyltransferase [Anaerolineae bacterium]MCB0239808.1 class I SAM-dependent methyltransferase [Anaerolineae bacterium]MCB0249103.1 class I SAM-dependent methyltransferase [Anaerolineae bacterium]MCB9130957.1 class I SAM-dependent methyltransferase [Anaerolineales bacterium]
MTPSVASDATTRFSSRVADYVGYRPSYPSEMIAFLTRECGLSAQSVIADIGSGTGLLSRLFLENGNQVYGVEPNAEMRAAAEQLLIGFPNFTSLSARAEATTLADTSVDFVTAGQAFHWFNHDLTRREFERILRPAGWIALVWNDRQTDTTPFLSEYERLLQTYAVDYAAVNHKQVDPSALQRVFGGDVGRVTFDNRQRFDLAGVTGRLMSSSYAPLPGHPNYEPLMTGLRAAFDRYNENGIVEFLYTTELFYIQR